MKRTKNIILSILPLMITACTSYYGGPPPSVASAPGDYGNYEDRQSLASLFTGQIVNKEEQILRDTLKRQIILDFPIKVGIISYQINTELDSTDRDATFESVKKVLADSGKVRETVEISANLISGSANLDELRRIGARFQTDVLILISGSHEFGRARNQELSFWDSFSDQVYYESKVNFEAIALDIYTGTLLSPLNINTKGEPILLDTGALNFSEQQYQYQKSTETKAWSELAQKTKENILLLEKEVLKRQAELNTLKD